MAFTTAGTPVVNLRHRQNFTGLWSDMYAITIPTTDPASIAAGAEDTQSYTINGLALGDVVLGWSMSKDVTIDGDITIYVSAANTLTIRISNLNGASALDYTTPVNWKILIGRPAF